MHTIGVWARTIFSRLLFIAVLIVFIPFFLVILPLPNRWFYHSRIYYWCIHVLYWLIIKCSLLPVHFKGVENIPKDGELIFVANHQSSLDIPLIGALVMYHSHVWIATITLLESWIFRIWLPYIPSVLLVDTEKIRKAMSTLLKTIKVAQKNAMHIMIFPEGMRHTDGEVHEFFSGFAVLARRMQRPVVPVRIFGANKAYPPDSFLVYYHPITVVVGEPLYYHDGEATDHFSERVREWFMQQNAS